MTSWKALQSSSFIYRVVHPNCNPAVLKKFPEWESSPVSSQRLAAQQKRFWDLLRKVPVSVLEPHYLLWLSTGLAASEQQQRASTHRKWDWKLVHFMYIHTSCSDHATLLPPGNFSSQKVSIYLHCKGWTRTFHAQADKCSLQFLMHSEYRQEGKVSSRSQGRVLNAL